MADKINAIKIKQPNGSYSDQIPISVLVQNVQWDQNHSLLDALGSVDLSSSGKGNLQHQIDELDEDKISHDDFNSQLDEFLSEQIKEDTETWLEENINPGEGFGITTNLTLSGWAADAKAVGDAIDAKTFPIDSTLSDSSTNPVQNKVVTSAISELNGSLDELVGNSFSGDYAIGDIVFDVSDFAVGDVIYYKTHMASGVNVAGYIELKDSENNRIGMFGVLTTYQASTGVPIMGCCTVPDSFDHAVWAGSRGGHVDYITKHMPVEYFEKYYIQKNEIISESGFAPNSGYNAVTQQVVTTQGYRLIHYVPVKPGSLLHFNYSLNSANLGYAFFDININLISKYISLPSEDTEVDIVVPEGVAYARITYKASNENASIHVIPPELTQKEWSISPYKRHEIKQYGGYYGNYSHVAFASIANFAGKTIIVYRCGYSHDGSTSVDVYADLQLDVRHADGTFEHVRRFTASDFGAVGDARDFHLGVSRNGQYLLMVGGFNSVVNNVKSWDTIIACFDANLNIIDYQLFHGNNDYFFGTPIETPTGHLLITSFTRGLGHTYIYRSDDVFSGTVSSLTFTKTDVLPDSTKHSECCLGYYNDLLVLLVRYEENVGKCLWTNDLEGVTGWVSATMPYRIESPTLLQHSKGDYLPFVACHRYSDHRDGIIGYLKIDTDNIAVNVVAEGNIDTDLEQSFNGYPCFVTSGDENYDITYYQEYSKSTITSNFKNTGLYYKRINARQIIPQLAYLL